MPGRFTGGDRVAVHLIVNRPTHRWASNCVCARSTERHAQSDHLMFGGIPGFRIDRQRDWLFQLYPRCCRLIACRTHRGKGDALERCEPNTSGIGIPLAIQPPDASFKLIFHQLLLSSGESLSKTRDSGSRSQIPKSGMRFAQRKPERLELALTSRGCA
jgi:hypothetical protein